LLRRLALLFGVRWRYSSFNMALAPSAPRWRRTRRLRGGMWRQMAAYGDDRTRRYRAAHRWRRLRASLIVRLWWALVYCAHFAKTSSRSERSADNAKARQTLLASKQRAQE